MKEKKAVDIWKIALEAIFMALFATAVSLGASWINKSDLQVNVTSPILTDGVYTTMIDLKNFSKTDSQKDITILLLLDNELIYWESDTECKEMVQNDITIYRIAPDSNCSILLETKQPLNASNLRITSEAKTSIIFLDKQKNFSKSIIIAFITNVAALATTYTVTFSLLEKKRLERRAIYEEQENRMQEQLNRRLSKAEKDVLENVRIQKETQLFYAARFTDYARELTFWKDTVRKLLYALGKSEKDAEILFDVVTDSLKTYTTRKIDKQDYETINYLARRIARTMSPEKKDEQ